ncbi:hypothetical protein KKB44_00795 [Candidatus Micrarchaeota archaeon]|nr:hypothetical protein [Candidatus Micrarchaeota archaeon]
MRQLLPLLAFFIAAAVMLGILLKGFEIAPEFEIPFAILSILAIGAFSVIGLFEKSIIKYAYYSAIIQFAYFLLDISTAFLINKPVSFAVIQFINFMIAGSLFALIIALLHNTIRKEGVPEYAGFYENNQFIILALVISCLALGGMPGFNIFVGEFIIYSSLFVIHPALTVLAIFAGLLCFIFYFRICYVMFAGKVKKSIQLGLISRFIITLLALLIVVLGVIPNILMQILEWYA